MAIQDTIKSWPWYQQAILWIIISAVLFWGGHKYLLKPKKEKIDQLTQEKEVLIQEINKGETLKARFIEFQAELVRLESQLQSLKRILPESEEVADLYSRIQQEGAELGLTITNFKPGAHVAKEFYDEWPIQMALTGNYHILAKFFERLGKLYRIINVNDVIVRTQPSGSYTVNATCIATTFIYREEPQTKPKTGGPP